MILYCSVGLIWMGWSDFFDPSATPIPPIMGRKWKKTCFYLMIHSSRQEFQKGLYSCFFNLFVAFKIWWCEFLWKLKQNFKVNDNLIIESCFFLSQKNFFCWKKIRWAFFSPSSSIHSNWLKNQLQILWKNSNFILIECNQITFQTSHQ